MPVTLRKSPSRFEPVIAVLTSKITPTILAEGGTGAWVLSRVHARQKQFAVCIWNGEPHRGTAFLVGRIKSIVTSPENPDRWLIAFSEYAEIEARNAWKGWRNPVRYTDFQALGIEPSELVFKAIPKQKIDKDSFSSDGSRESGRLTIQPAKEGLSSTFGVPVESIEITIKM